MKLKKFFAAALAAVMLISFATGCKEKKKEEAVMNTDGKFTPQKDMDITVWVTQGSDYVPPVTAKDNVVEKWLKEKTRVNVKNAYGNGGGQWEAVLARLISGGNFPEIVACGGGQGPTHFAKLAKAKEIWELTPELLQTYAPDVWKKVPKEMWERIKVDGKIYGIPYSFPVDREIDPDITDEELAAWGEAVPSNIGTSLWIRDDILKMIYPDAMSYEDIMKLMEEKGTIGDELYDVPLDSTEKIVDLMRKIKNLNLKAGEKQVYAFGYAGADCWVPFARLGPDLSGYVGHNYITSWNTEKNEIEIPLTGNVIKETAKLQNQLLREKVIDPESLMHTDAQCKEKILNGQYAMAVLSAVEHPPIINSNLESSGKKFHYRPLYTKVTPQKGYGVCKNNVSWGKSLGILKTVSADDLPQILNWINTQFTDEWEEVRYWGPKEAGLYEDKADGSRLFKNEELNKKYVYKQATNINQEDCYGLNDGCGMFYVTFKTQSKWDPMIYNHKMSYVLVPESAGKLSPESKYKVDPVIAPPFNVWDAEYANLDSVVSFWSTRSQWEDPFKLTLVAKSDEEFEKKWKEAVDNLKSVADVDQMAKDMTKIAKELIK